MTYRGFISSLSASTRQLLLCGLCVVGVAAAGCSKSPETSVETQEAPQAEAVASPSPNDSAPEPVVRDAEWTFETIRQKLVDAGWQVDAQVPEFPDVALAPGAEVQGMTVQHNGLRGEVFLYTYTRAGYAEAHERAGHAHSAMLRQASRLLVVAGQDTPRAEAMLEALAPILP